MRERVGVRVRLAVEGDMGYILKTWREVYRRFSTWSKNMERQIYHPHHRRVIEGLLREATPVVACNEADPTHIIGFIVGERFQGHLVVHFAFVRKELRNFGVGKTLLEALEFDKREPILATHWTYDLKLLPAAYRIVYNPYLLFKQFREPHNVHG